MRLPDQFDRLLPVGRADQPSASFEDKTYSFFYAAPARPPSHHGICFALQLPLEGIDLLLILGPVLLEVFLPSRLDKLVVLHL
jgi:hypothetical protein